MPGSYLHAANLLGRRAIYIGEAHAPAALHPAHAGDSAGIGCIRWTGHKPIDRGWIDPILPIVVEVREQSMDVYRRHIRGLIVQGSGKAVAAAIIEVVALVFGAWTEESRSIRQRIRPWSRL